MKKIFIIIAVAFIMLLSACSLDDLLPSKDKSSQTSEDKFNYGSLDNPYEVSDIFALFDKFKDGEESEKRFYVIGKVDSMLFDGYFSVVLVDNYQSLEVKNLTDRNNKSYSSVEAFPAKIGDEIIIWGYLSKYSNILSIDRARLELVINSQTDTPTPTPITTHFTSSIDKPLSVKEALEMATYLQNGSNSETHYYKGVVAGGDTIDASSFFLSSNNATIRLTALYSLDGLLYDSETLPLKPNDEITIYGTVDIIDNEAIIHDAKLIFLNSEKQDETIRTLKLLTMNDIHGFIRQDGYNQKGLSNMSYRINEIRNESSTDDVILVANGDMFQGTTIVKASYGRVLVDVMSAMNFDACGIGNHEFDWGIETILQYFDGDLSNGEANFPLLNANIIDKRTGKLLTISGGNIFDSTIVDKDGIKVGIIGYIGNVKNSINQEMVANYDFDTDFSSSVLQIGTKLKDSGADVIIVSIHGGSADGVMYYEPNIELAALTYNGKYLVDAVINGHTHTHQDGIISRGNDVGMPVIQTAGNRNNYMVETGRIDLEFDLVSRSVKNIAISYENVGSSGNNYDSKVENIINEYYLRDKDKIDEVYTTAISEISRYSEQTYAWVTNVVNKAMNSDIFICNTGGLRTNIKAGKIDASVLYEFNPFDNKIVLYDGKKSDVENFLANNSDYYFSGTSQYYNEKATIRIAVIDYVFNSNYYKSLAAKALNVQTTSYILRDLLAADLSLRDSFDINGDITAKIASLINSDLMLKRVLYVNIYRSKRDLINL